ncbi:LysR family transcriptional regulator [Rhizobacter sp. Root1221]|uniref:LysR family transcriptional regulator n=1 Tax=Rhizobacter sp. Root1221 TaxID=1736433 RepID=UPI0006FC3A54|nr:LysR family transcriptional regulator [Rhizobacter sp. Root1221]KQV84564.1 LysR family transcriptional regulator [Rhizobacter sp. Root1221]
MDTLKAMATYVRAVELGSLSAAARELRITQPTVSKAVAALEKTVGVRLLERSTVHLAPTDEGQQFYVHARRVLEQHAEALDAARGLAGSPSGLLRINAPLAIGQLRLNAWLLGFLRIHAGVQAELILNDRFVDLVEEGVDVALRLGGPPPPHVVAREVGVSRRGLVASPAYVANAPRIRRPQDLAGHEVLQFAWATSLDTLTLDGPRGARETVAVSGRYRVNSSMSIREALVLGAGPGLAPDWLVRDLLDRGDLVRVLPTWRAEPQRAWVMYQAQRYRPARTRLLIDALAAAVPGWPGFQR